MKKGMVIGIVAAVLLGVVFTGVYFKRLGIRQHEISLGKRYDAQESVVEVTLFNMRTAIKNIHSCTDEWAEKFIMVVAKQVEGRPGKVVAPSGGAAPAAGLAGMLTGGGGAGIVVTRESEALGIPPDLYIKLSNAIEGHLGDFTRQQKVWVDIWRVHATYCEDPKINEFWNVDLLSKVKDKPEMITSAETKDAMDSKQMSETLF